MDLYTGTLNLPTHHHPVLLSRAIINYYYWDGWEKEGIGFGRIGLSGRPSRHAHELNGCRLDIGGIFILNCNTNVRHS